jgi:acetylornithine deacetylase/succinyl-diaminopimelate desuccinylase-like protein
MKSMLSGGRVAALACCLLPFAASAAGKDAAVPADVSANTLEMLKRSVAFKTVLGEGQVPGYARYLAGELEAHGFAAGDIKITPMGETATLTAVYRGSNPKLKPLLVASHMDVVVAKREEWERDPFTAVVEDGFLFGRGSGDNKFGLVTSMNALFWMKKEGFRPKRDIVIVLSGDEETAQDTTAALAQELKGAEMLLNSDAGGAYLDDAGKPTVYSMQAAEKTYMDFEVTTTNPGGHSSRPGPTNAIAELAQAIDKVAAFRFPAHQSEITTAYFTAAGPLTPGKSGEMMRRYAADPADKEAYEYLYTQPEYVGQLGTTCVPTMLRGGHAPNALPQKATVNVNCRVFPGESVESVQSTLVRVIDDPKVEVKLVSQPVPSDASPLREDVMKALRKAIDLRAPGLPIVPSMSAGATDSLYFRNLGVPSYGVGALFMRASDSFAHGLNERIPVASLDGALVQWRSLLRDLSAK